MGKIKIRENIIGYFADFVSTFIKFFIFIGTFIDYRKCEKE
jgi:hypothetical protein